MRSTARLVALGLMLCVAIGPMVLDVCALSCEASADGRADSAPACHHGTTASGVGTHLKSSPAPCGHDHHLLAATAAPSRAAADEQRVTAVGPLATVSSRYATRSAAVRVWPSAPLHCPVPDTLRLTPLRV